MQRIALEIICCLLILAAIAQPSPATETGAHLVLDSENESLPAPMVSSLIHLEVSGIVARATVTQEFFNPSEQWLNGVYHFPLPENAAVTALRLRIGNREVNAHVAERQEAQQTYEQACGKGVATALLAQHRPDVFSASIGNIGPGEAVEVEIALYFQVRYDEDRFRLRFPLLVANRYSGAGSGSSVEPLMPTLPVLAASEKHANPFALRIDLTSGYRLSSIDSPTHAILVLPNEQGQTIELDDQVAPSDGDFVLEWTPVAEDRPRPSVTVQEIDGHYYAQLLVLPPADPSPIPTPREVIFVIDTSDSMRGTALEQAKKAIVLGLRDLVVGDRFNIIRFSSKPEPFHSQALAATEQHLDEATRWVEALKPNGGTEILSALEVALSGPAIEGWLRQIVLLTDGQVDDEAAFFETLRRDLGTARVFTAGIGAAPNGHFMRRSAKMGRGTYTFISDPKEVEKQFGQLLKKLKDPVLTDIEIQWDDPMAAPALDQPRDLYFGELLVAAARLESLDGWVRLSGWRDGQHLQLALRLSDARAGSGIGKLWARQRIDALTYPIQRSPVHDVRQQIVELALKHQLVSAHTSLVAVGQEPMAPPGAAVTRQVPVLMPRSAPPADAWDVGSEEFAEQIIVSAKTPLISETTCIVVVLNPAFDDHLPLRSAPWSLVARAPGIWVDGTPGQSSTPPRFSGLEAASVDNLVRLDGLEISDDLSGQPSLSLAQLQLHEVETAVGGCAGANSYPGRRIDLTTKQGGNEWRGSARHRQAETSEVRSERASLLDGSSTELELGGRLKRDQLFFWAARSDVSREGSVLGGQTLGSEAAHTTGELLALPDDRGQIAVSWHNSRSRDAGRGAGPDRDPSATSDRRDDGQLHHLVGDYVFSDVFYLSGRYGEIDQRFEDHPSGERGPVTVDRLGRIRGHATSRQAERHIREGQIHGTSYLGFGSTSHELEYGARWRRYAATDLWQSAGLPRIENGANLGLPSPLGLLRKPHDSRGQTDLELRAGWLQDDIETRRLTLALGLRIDEQRGRDQQRTSNDLLTLARDAEWLAVVPRVGFNLRLDDTFRTLLRGGYGRFTTRLGPSFSRRLAGGPPFVDQALFRDADFDLHLDPSEGASRRPLPATQPDFLSPGLEPEIIDEWLLGVEHETVWPIGLGLHLRYRRAHQLHERRLLVRESPASDGWRQATAEDWLPSGTVSGLLPNGDPYSNVVYDLRPGLELSPSGLWVNGDRRRHSLEASLTWRARSHRLRSDGHITWSEGEWSLGPDFVRFADPTDHAGNGDNGGSVAELTARPGTAPIAVGARWSFHGNLAVDLPWGLDLGLVVDAREGYPLPFYRRVVRPNAGLVRVSTTTADTFRAPDILTVDLRLAKRFQLGAADLTLAAEAFNLFDAATPLLRELDLGVTRGGAVHDRLEQRSLKISLKLGFE